MNRFTLALASLLALATPALAEEAAAPAHGGGHIEDVAFSFEGPFGTYDTMQLQRGLQIYTAVCSDCHGLKYVPLRQLEDLGYSDEEVRAYAAQFSVTDKETGEDRTAVPADHFGPSAVENAPDLSLMAKARAGFHGPYGLGINQLLKGMGGPEYIVAILTGYTGQTKKVAGVEFYENHAFPGGWIAMTPPLEDGKVTFADGHPNDVHHMAVDIAAYLMWAAEPHLNDRKHTGLLGVFFLTFLSVLFYLSNKRIWAKIKGH